MRKILISILLFTTFAKAQQVGINFQQNIHWKEIVAKAKAENKFILIDCYTTWCGPCIYMSREIFPKQEVGTFYNEHYLNLKLQFDSTKKDGEEIKFQYPDAVLIRDKYHVDQYPTFLFFNSDGELVNQAAGSCDAAEFITRGKNSLDPEQQYYTQIKKYNTGVRDTQFLKNLTLLAMNSQKIIYRTFAHDYINKISNILEDTNDMHFVYKTTRFTSDTGFTLIMGNLGEFEKIIGKKILEKTLLTVIMQSEYALNYNIWNAWDKIKWGNYSKEIIKKYYPLGQDALFEIKINAFQNENHWVNYARTINSYLNSHELTSVQLNEFAWILFRNCSNVEILKSGLKWSKKSFSNQVSIDPGYMDTYANLLYKSGNSKEAINVEKKAQQLAISQGANKDWGEDVIEKIKKGIKTW